MRKLSAAAAVLAMLLSGCEASSAIEPADKIPTDILTEAAYASITEEHGTTAVTETETETTPEETVTVSESETTAVSEGYEEETAEETVSETEESREESIGDIKEVRINDVTYTYYKELEPELINKSRLIGIVAKCTAAAPSENYESSFAPVGTNIYSYENGSIALLFADDSACICAEEIPSEETEITSEEAPREYSSGLFITLSDLPDLTGYEEYAENLTEESILMLYTITVPEADNISEGYAVMALYADGRIIMGVTAEYPDADKIFAEGLSEHLQIIDESRMNAEDSKIIALLSGGVNIQSGRWQESEPAPRPAVVINEPLLISSYAAGADGMINVYDKDAYSCITGRSLDEYAIYMVQYAESSGAVGDFVDKCREFYYPDIVE